MNEIPRLEWPNIKIILEHWFTVRNRDQFPWIVPSPQHVEMHVLGEVYTLPPHQRSCLCGHSTKQHDTIVGCHACACPYVAKRIVHVGHIDINGVLRLRPEVPCIVDHKTTGRIDARFLNQFRQDSQITGYLWDASKANPAHRPEDIQAFINALEVILVPTSDRQCTKHRTTYAECGLEHINFQVIGPIFRTPDQITQWRENTITFATKYHTMRTMHPCTTPQEGPYTGACGYCEFREWCLNGRREDQLDRMFTHSPWVHEVNEPARLQEQTIYVDNSTLKSVAVCTTQAVLRYAYGYSNADQRGPLLAGTAIHAAMETWFGGGSVEASLAAAEAVLSPSPPPAGVSA